MSRRFNFFPSIIKSLGNMLIARRHRPYTYLKMDNNSVISAGATKDMELIIKSKIMEKEKQDDDDPFYIVDLQDIVSKYELWKDQLPRVEPFYAMKANHDPYVLEVLARLGIGFDCASKLEIQTILDLGVPADKIIYAHPCKQNSYINYAEKHGVSMMTFDDLSELFKIKERFPKANLVIRLAVDDSKSLLPLNEKFGCSLRTVDKLLKAAKDLDLNVIGVSFHVGSECLDDSIYESAIESARTAFDIAKEIGFDFHLLDIGGGFSGQHDAKTLFYECAASVRRALDQHFPIESGVRVVAEPGHFFVSSAFTLVTNVISKKSTKPDEELDASNGPPTHVYYVNDGAFGSFLGLAVYDMDPKPSIIGELEGVERFKSRIWGPTCDSIDCVRTDVLLPELDIGSWIIFKDMGAYSISCGSTFNGMPTPRRFYISAIL